MSGIKRSLTTYHTRPYCNELTRAVKRGGPRFGEFGVNRDIGRSTC